MTIVQDEPNPSQSSIRRRYLVIWDASCELCRRAVLWAARRNRDGLLSFVPYQALAARSGADSLERGLRQAVHVVGPRGEVARGGGAVLVVLALTGWPRIASFLSLPPLRFLVQAGYRWTARHRRLVLRLLRFARMGDASRA